MGTMPPYSAAREHVVAMKPKMRPSLDGAEEAGEVPLVPESAEDKHSERRAKKMANKLHFALTKGID